jgi:hypothetical protein
LGCREEETSTKMGMKVLVPSAGLYTYTSQAGGQNSFGAFTIFSGLVTARLFPPSVTKKCFEKNDS